MSIEKPRPPSSTVHGAKLATFHFRYIVIIKCSHCYTMALQHRKFVIELQDNPNPLVYYASSYKRFAVSACPLLAQPMHSKYTEQGIYWSCPKHATSFT